MLCNIRTPRMNAITERWIGDADASSWTAPSSEPDHLRRILHAYEISQSAPAARSLDSAAPLKPLPEPVDLDRYRVRRQTHTGCLINEYAWQHYVNEVLGMHRASPHGSNMLGSSRSAPAQAR